jgi:hypothetical protein
MEPPRLPDPQVDWLAFETALQQRLSRQVQVRSLLSMQYVPWIDVGELKLAYDPCYAHKKKEKVKSNTVKGNKDGTSSGGVGILLAVVFVILGLLMVFLPADL